MKRLCDCLLVDWRSHRISWVLWRFHGNLCLNRIYWEYHGNILPKFCPNQMWRFYNQVPGWWVFPCFFWLDQLKVVFVSRRGCLNHIQAGNLLRARSLCFSDCNWPPRQISKGREAILGRSDWCSQMSTTLISWRQLWSESWRRGFYLDLCLPSLSLSARFSLRDGIGPAARPTHKNIGMAHMAWHHMWASQNWKWMYSI